MRKNPYFNLFLGLMILVAQISATIFAMNQLSYLTWAGEEAFLYGALIILVQGIVQGIAFTRWYCKVNAKVVDEVNIEKKRKIAFRWIGKFFGISFVVNVAIAGAAALLMFLQLIFQDISMVYAISAVVSEIVIGQLMLLVLMRFVAVPNRVYERC